VIAYLSAQASQQAFNLATLISFTYGLWSDLKANAGYSSEDSHGSNSENLTCQQRAFRSIRSGRME
jgi:hypothetical protein